MGGRKRIVAVTFVLVLIAIHLGGLAYRLLPSRVVARLPRPVMQIAGLCERVARWDMFRTLRTVDRIVVEGSDPTGAWYDLANPYHRGFDPWGRFIDRRLRSFHDRLSDKRRLSTWGLPYLRYLCRVGAAAHPELHQARVVRILSRHPAGAPERARPIRLVVLRQRCARAGGTR